MGLETAARRNGWHTLKSANFKSMLAVPNVWILDPLAAKRKDESGRDLSLAGNTEMSAPVSTKKDFSERSSQTDKVPEGAVVMMRMDWCLPGATAARLWRFPPRRTLPPPSSVLDATHYALGTVQDLHTCMPCL